ASDTETGNEPTVRMHRSTWQHRQGLVTPVSLAVAGRQVLSTDAHTRTGCRLLASLAMRSPKRERRRLASAQPAPSVCRGELPAATGSRPDHRSTTRGACFESDGRETAEHLQEASTLASSRACSGSFNR